MLCDKFVIHHKFVEEKALPSLCLVLLYSTVNKSSMSVSMSMTYQMLNHDLSFTAV